MVNTRIRLIIFYAAKDGEALYSQQKQDQELTVAQIIHIYTHYVYIFSPKYSLEGLMLKLKPPHFGHLM